MRQEKSSNKEDRAQKKGDLHRDTRVQAHLALIAISEMLCNKHCACTTDSETDDLKEKDKLIYQPHSSDFRTAKGRNHHGIRNIDGRGNKQLKGNRQRHGEDFLQKVFVLKKTCFGRGKKTFRCHEKLLRLCTLRLKFGIVSACR